MPRRVFPAGTVTNTTGAPLRLTFHADNTTGRRETDLYTVDGSNNLSERISNGVILTDAVGAYGAFAGPDDIDVLYVVKHDSSSRTSITATGTVASFSASAARSDLGLGAVAVMSVAQAATAVAADSALTGTYEPLRTGNTLCAIGDSITAQSGSGTVATWHSLACALSMGRLQFVRPSATAGYNSTQALSTLLPAVLAMSPKPDYCAVLIGTNDVDNTWQSNITSIFAQLKAAKIQPIACTLPPLNSTPTAPVTKNAYLAAWCERNEVPIVDFYEALANTADGTFKSGYSGDGTHPSMVGTQAMAQAFLRSGVVDTTRPWRPHVARTAIDGATLIGSGYGLFLVDTNADGVADGWTAGGDGVGVTYSIIPDPTINGSWQRITRTAGSAVCTLSLNLSGTWSVGDRLVMSALVRTRNVQANTIPCYLGLTFSGAAQSDPPEAKLMYSWQADVNRALLSMEMVVPAATTSIPVRIQLGNGVGILDVAQVTVTNLTTLGVS